MCNLFKNNKKILIKKHSRFIFTKIFTFATCIHGNTKLITSVHVVLHFIVLYLVSC